MTEHKRLAGLSPLRGVLLCDGSVPARGFCWSAAAGGGVSSRHLPPHPAPAKQGHGPCRTRRKLSSLRAAARANRPKHKSTGQEAAQRSAATALTGGAYGKACWCANRSAGPAPRQAATCPRLRLITSCRLSGRTEVRITGSGSTAKICSRSASLATPERQLAKSGCPGGKGGENRWPRFGAGPAGEFPVRGGDFEMKSPTAGVTRTGANGL